MSETLSYAEALRSQLYVRCTAADLKGLDTVAEADWVAFADSWNRLPVDEFMAGGETYRHRRHSLFDVHHGGRIEPLAARPYFQSEEINKLEGGVQRSYPAIEANVVELALFRGLLTGVTELLDERHGPGSWHHQCFQNRTTTSVAKTGDPTPWGAHRDGVDYVVTLLIDRHNMDGGQTRLYDVSTQETIFTETLRQRGDLLVADDRRTLHDATRIVPVNPAEPGHRDVFIDVVTSLPSDR